MEITIHESSRTKVPSVYVGKTFVVVQTTAVGDRLPSLRKNADGSDAISTWDAYEGVTSTGKKISIVKYVNHPDKIFVKREGYTRGTWIYDFTIA